MDVRFAMKSSANDSLMKHICFRRMIWSLHNSTLSLIHLFFLSNGSGTQVLYVGLCMYVPFDSFSFLFLTSTL